MVNNIYTLPQIDFVGGSTADLIFNVYWGTENPRPFGMVGCVANFAVIDYVNKTGTPIISKTMEVRLNADDTFYNVLYVELKPSDTLDLFGKYIYQITIKDVDNSVDIPQQGILYIHNNINKQYLRA